jgi:hypothetical protein
MIFDELNEIVKDYIFDLYTFRIRLGIIVSSEVGSKAAMGFGNVNDPSLGFRHNRFRYLRYLDSIDRLEVTEKVLEEL